jgi:hypothetical protein
MGGLGQSRGESAGAGSGSTTRAFATRRAGFKSVVRRDGRHLALGPGALRVIDENDQHAVTERG